jgi:hypothetical protein
MAALPIGGTGAYPSPSPPADKATTSAAFPQGAAAPPVAGAPPGHQPHGVFNKMANAYKK